MSDEEPKEPSTPRRRTNSPGRRPTDALGVDLLTHIERTEDRLSKWLVRGLIAFSVIAIATTIALIGFGFVLDQIRDTRAEFTRTTCQATNHRHDATYAALAVAAKHDIDHAKELGLNPVEVARRRDVTLGLIDALVPKQDCDYLVKLSVGDITPTPSPKSLIPPPNTKPTATRTPRTP